MNCIKIFMCCHKGYDIVPPLCEPMQCGSAIFPPIEGALRDDGGENISHRNREYCELTAHYFAWKNVATDYYGFCHYRRFFCAGKTRLPYIALRRLSERNRKALLGSEEYWRRLITSHEIITVKSENMGLTVREHYINAPYQYAEDLEIFVKILTKNHPELAAAADEYLSQNECYFCNMFVMDKPHFFEYCTILFGALSEFDGQKTMHGSFQADRTDGYLGEVFTGIYITYCRKNGAKIAEVPRLDVGCSFGKRLTFKLLPPESGIRFLAKRIAPGKN